jgi:hypothetical protein
MQLAEVKQTRYEASVQEDDRSITLPPSECTIQAPERQVPDDHYFKYSSFIDPSRSPPQLSAFTGEQNDKAYETEGGE